MDVECTLDEFPGLGLKICQPQQGYRFSLDPFLLCGFAQIAPEERLLDLGTGCGVLPLLLQRRFRSQKIVGLELQPELADLAKRNVEINDLRQQVEILAGDLRQCEKYFSAQSFDVVVSNPPFRQAGCGRLAPDPQRAAARHELAGGLPEFVAAAAFGLRNGGRLYLIHLAERLVDLLEEMRRHRIEPKRLRTVHSRAGDRARLVLVEGRRAGRPGLCLEPPLCIYADEGYSAEVLEWYGGEGIAAVPEMD
jgi:tRNA1(Val) A37 N6-methylase TrmN6